MRAELKALQIANRTIRHLHIQLANVCLDVARCREEHVDIPSGLTRRSQRAHLYRGNQGRIRKLKVQYETKVYSVPMHRGKTMTKTLHHRSKRFEVQQYSDTTLSWKPTYHTDDPQDALDHLQAIIKNGYYSRVLDRVTRGIMEAKPEPKYNCMRCHDTKVTIHDTCDHRGEHVQTEHPCECTLEDIEEEEHKLSI